MKKTFWDYLFLLDGLITFATIVAVFVLIFVKSKAFLPIIFVLVISSVLIYRKILESLKSGRISWMGKTFSVNQKYMFSLVLMMWISPVLWFPAVAIGYMLNYLPGSIFSWALLPLISVAIYCLVLIANPSLKKIGDKKT
jgi:hypothetical protein